KRAASVRRKIDKSGRSVAWLSRLTGGQEIGSSNLPVPTISSAERRTIATSCRAPMLTAGSYQPPGGTTQPRATRTALMPCDYVIDLERRLVRTTISGVVTGAELRELRERLGAGPSARPA